MGLGGIATVPLLPLRSPPSDVLIPLAGTVAEGAPIIPISAQLKYNIEVVCEYIVKKIPVPVRDFTSEPRLIGKKQNVSRLSSACQPSIKDSLEVNMKISEQVFRLQSSDLLT